MWMLEGLWVRCLMWMLEGLWVRCLMWMLEGLWVHRLMDRQTIMSLVPDVGPQVR